MVNNAQQLHPYMVECRHKRRKLLVQASSASEEGIHLHDLQDELLVEILCRLPCSKSAIQCKCVCKRWCGLISEPYFVSRFIASKVPCIEKYASNSKRHRMLLKAKGEKKRVGSDYENNTSSSDITDVVTEKGERSFVIVSCNAIGDKSKGLTMHLKDPVVNLHNFSVCPLSCLVDGNASQPYVVGGCNDLLLFCRVEGDRYDYYISNVQTRQWLLLPSPSFYYRRSLITGFMSDPYSSCEGGNMGCNVILNAAYRYCIVVAPYKYRPTSKYSAHLFSSITSQWIEIVLSLPRKCLVLRGLNSFGFAGMLHFRCFEGIIGFDPYRGINSPKGLIRCHFIGWPAAFQNCYGLQMSFGRRQGRLQVVMLDEYMRLFIWVLKDYKRGTWSLQHEIAKHELIPRGFFPAKHWEVSQWPGSLIGMHPFNSDIIYLLDPHRIWLINAKKKIVEVASRAPAKFIGLRCPTQFYSMLPIWPTPLPTLV